MPSTNMSRRGFLSDSMKGVALGALFPAVGLSEETAETGSKTQPAADAHGGLLDRDGLIQSVLVALNPTVVSALISPVVFLTGVSRMIHKNRRQFEAGELDREKLIYNNADKFSGVFLEITLATITALGRAGVSALCGPKLNFLSSRQLSEIKSVTAFHAHSALYVYLYNPLQAALRHAYIQALTKHDAFQYDPRMVPLAVIAAELNDLSSQMNGAGISDDARTLLSAVTVNLVGVLLTSNPGNVPLTEAVLRDVRRLLTPRGLLDMLSVGLSYYATIQGNFAFGRLAGIPSRFGLYTRDMLERIERQGCPQTQQDEELQSSISYALNSAANNLYEGFIQVLADRGLGLQSHQRNDVAATHLREILGVVIGGLVYFELQGVLERQVRSAVEQTPQSLPISLAKRYLSP